ncbi:MAG: DUF3052 domain-containing protein [Candidatus Velthaea sp.]
MAGYSSRTLGAKLGLKPGMTALFLDAPRAVTESLAADRRLLRTANADLDFLHWFVADRAVLERDFARRKAQIAHDGMLWVSWRKGGAKAVPPCDVSETLVREAGLRAGLVDVKVCAVDDVWSGLKFVYRLSDRGGARK